MESSSLFKSHVPVHQTLERKGKEELAYGTFLSEAIRSRGSLRLCQPSALEDLANYTDESAARGDSSIGSAYAVFRCETTYCQWPRFIVNRRIGWRSFCQLEGVIPDNAEQGTVKPTRDEHVRFA